MSASTIITSGFGPGATIGLVITGGFGFASASLTVSESALRGSFTPVTSMSSAYTPAGTMRGSYLPSSSLTGVLDP